MCYPLLWKIDSKTGEKDIDKKCRSGYNTGAHLRECWNGRQARLRCVWLRRVGSSPISRTISLWNHGYMVPWGFFLYGRNQYLLVIEFS